MIRVINRKFKAVVFALLVVLAGNTTYADASDEASAAKYKLHAVFLYNFIGSVEWPKLVYTGNVKNVDVCIIGRDTLGAIIDTVAKKAESKGDIKINVRRGVSHADVAGCNIAYISKSEEANIAAITAKTKDSATLTVSEVGGFAKSGGVIEFVLNGSSVSFIVNNKNAKAVDLKINPQLLEVAQEVIN